MLWMTRTFVVIALGLLAACGGSPTSPSQTASKQPAAQTSADPTPNPAPEPTRTVLHAVVENAHWYPNATFTLPPRFDVIIEGDTAKIATLDPLPLSFRNGNDQFIVKTREFEFSVLGATFSFNGLAGQASGRVTRE